MKIELENAVVYQGSNLDVLPTLPDNSVDSIVTDPPYELGFMGKSWDNSGIAYSVELWTECMRVLKPGGHLLAFSGSRTYHRMVVAIEDAGFEIRDMISWISNKTFPKSMDISKAIDKQFGAKREVIGTNRNVVRESKIAGGSDFGGFTQANADITVAATDEAKQWEGWGTGLKPTVEPIVMARKPVEGTVANNVLTYGTGGLNIDGSRIGTEERTNQPASSLGNGQTLSGGQAQEDRQSTTAIGRWPANIILDSDSAELLDEQSGISKSPATYVRKADGLNTETYGKGIGESAGKTSLNFGDAGGASRFFYVAKASKKDRNEGCELLPDYEWRNDGAAIPNRTERPFLPSKNHHPTVKPTSLMEYLIKLVTPPNGTVLDPFTGSGSTGKAALLSGFKFVGIELTEEYLPIIEGRLKWASQQVNKETNEVLF